MKDLKNKLSVVHVSIELETNMIKNLINSFKIKLNPCNYF